MTILETHVYSTTVGILTLEKFYWNAHVLKKLKASYKSGIKLLPNNK